MKTSCPLSAGFSTHYLGLVFSSCFTGIPCARSWQAFCYVPYTLSSWEQRGECSPLFLKVRRSRGWGNCFRVTWPVTSTVSTRIQVGWLRTTVPSGMSTYLFRTQYLTNLWNPLNLSYFSEWRQDHESPPNEWQQWLWQHRENNCSCSCLSELLFEQSPQQGRVRATNKMWAWRKQFSAGNPGHQRQSLSLASNSFSWGPFYLY